MGSAQGRRPRLHHPSRFKGSFHKIRKLPSKIETVDARTQAAADLCLGGNGMGSVPSATRTDRPCVNPPLGFGGYGIGSVPSATRTDRPCVNPPLGFGGYGIGSVPSATIVMVFW